MEKDILKTLVKGNSYLIKEKKPDKTFELFKLLIKNKIEPFCIARLHPKHIKWKYKIKVKSLWLSKKEYNYCLSPTDLGVLVSTAENFIKSAKNGVLLIEGLEYLILNNDFTKVLRAVADLIESVMESNCRILLPIDPDTLDSKELALLERNLVVIETEEEEEKLL
ncbi:MAG: DUF835 domain-containing protein [Candidatus Thermoplasmatota archaeon]|nr:DUF835 domain-containing protein [Candidatus Thermoplasmatota archaeon]